jgi:hypothetical protein
VMVSGFPVICGGIAVSSTFVHWSRPPKSFTWAASAHCCQSPISPWKATIVLVSLLGQVKATALQSALTPWNSGAGDGDVPRAGRAVEGLDDAHAARVLVEDTRRVRADVDGDAERNPCVRRRQ